MSDDVQFTVRRFQLAQLADWAMGAIPGGTTMRPVHGCFQVSAAPDLLQVAAVNQYISIAAQTPAVTAQSAGTVFLPARKLKAILAEAPERDVTVTVKGGAAAITAGSAAWQLRLPSSDGYTGLPDLSEARFAPVSREKLLAGLSAVRHAVGRDSGRPSFTQVSIRECTLGEGTSRERTEMCASAADSSQFARAPVPGFPVPAAVPASALDELIKLLKAPDDTAYVADSGRHVVFRAGAVTLAALKPAAPFPDTDALFLRPAQANDLALTVDKAALVTALRRVRINSDASTSAVALIADDSGPRPELTVTSRDAGGNSAEEVIPAHWAGGRQVLVVSAEFLSAMLAAHPGAECRFLTGKARGRVTSPLLLEDADAGVTGICLGMPPKLLGYEGKSDA